jgi:thioesterase domain-containing protein
VIFLATRSPIEFDRARRSPVFDPQVVTRMEKMDTGFPSAPTGASGGKVVVSEHVLQTVGRAWSRTLDRQSLADDVPFDEAGGDSLRFLILVYHMEEALGATLPLDLFDLSMAPSAVAAAVQGHLAGSNAPEPDELPQIFLLPGVGGDEPRLVRFREACAGSFHVVPVAYGDWRDWVQPGFDLERLLSDLTEDISGRAPEGPLMLAGYSMGGFIAYAVAGKLAEAGRTVRCVALLDASNLGAAAGNAESGGLVRKSFDRHEELHQIVAGFQSGIPGNVLARSVVRRLTSPRWRWLEPMAIRVSNMRLPWDFGYYLRGHLRIGLLERIIARHRANFAPRPALAGVPLLLFRSDAHGEADGDMGWTGYGQSVSVVPVVGDHFNMFDQPHLDVLAGRFMDAIRPLVRA